MTRFNGSRLLLAFLLSPLASWLVLVVYALAIGPGARGWELQANLRLIFMALMASYPATVLVGGPLVLWMAHSGLARAWSVVGVGALLATTPIVITDAIGVMTRSGVHSLTWQEIVLAGWFAACGIATATAFWMIAGPVLAQYAEASTRARPHAL